MPLISAARYCYVKYFKPKKILLSYHAHYIADSLLHKNGKLAGAAIILIAYVHYDTISHLTILQLFLCRNISPTYTEKERLTNTHKKTYIVSGSQQNRLQFYFFYKYTNEIIFIDML